MDENISREEFDKRLSDSTARIEAENVWRTVHIDELVRLLAQKEALFAQMKETWQQFEEQKTRIDFVRQSMKNPFPW